MVRIENIPILPWEIFQPVSFNLDAPSPDRPVINLSGSVRTALQAYNVPDALPCGIT